jgi:hypothetical protein
MIKHCKMLYNKIHSNFNNKINKKYKQLEAITNIKKFACSHEIKFFCCDLIVWCCDEVDFGAVFLVSNDCVFMYAMSHPVWNLISHTFFTLWLKLLMIIFCFTSSHFHLYFLDWNFNSFSNIFWIFFEAENWDYTVVNFFFL